MHPLWTSTLVRLNACEEALEWAEALPDDTTPEAAWTACERGDWLAWLLGALHRRDAITRQTLTLAAVASARTALPYLAGRPAEAATVACLDITERWCHGNASLAEVRSAQDTLRRVRREAWEAYRAARRAAAYDAAAYAAAADAAAYAAAADAYAAYAAAAYAADAYAYAAYAAAAAYAAVRKNHLRLVADAIRAAVPWSTVEAAVARLRSEVQS